jgi:hypothetical protein
MGGDWGRNVRFYIVYVYIHRYVVMMRGRHLLSRQNVDTGSAFATLTFWQQGKCGGCTVKICEC